MAEFTFVHVGLLVVVMLAGIVTGWAGRSSRSRREKIAITAGWQAQIDSQQSEHERLADQNKSLMEQVSQYQASNKDSKMRAKELSDSLQETFSRCDGLQRQLKEIRGNLEIAIVQRDNFKSDVDSNSMRDEATLNSLKEKDDEISRLRASLASWQERVPPLVERYRQRDLEAQQLEVELQQANDHVATLESMARGDSTRIEPVDSSSLPHGLDASNEAHAETSVQDVINLDDQIDIEPVNDMAATDNTRAPAAAAIENEPEVTVAPINVIVADDAAAESTDVSNRPVEGAENTAFSDILGNGYTGGKDTEDDLKKIKGIGPAIAKTLNELGIYRFNQIAEISEYDIDRVAHQLKGFRSRIYREDWIGQARLLQQQKNNESPPA